MDFNSIISIFQDLLFIILFFVTAYVLGVFGFEYIKNKDIQTKMISFIIFKLWFISTVLVYIIFIYGTNRWFEFIYTLYLVPIYSLGVTLFFAKKEKGSGNLVIFIPTTIIAYFIILATWLLSYKFKPNSLDGMVIWELLFQYALALPFLILAWKSVKKKKV